MRAPLRWLAPGAGLLALTGVAMVGACAMADRAEALFFRQQTAQSDLADTIVGLEMDRPRLAEQLYGMEDELHEACAPLREASQRKVSEEEIDADLEWAVFSALETCETKTRQVEQLVRRAESGAGPGDDAGPMSGLGVAGRDDRAR